MKCQVKSSSVFSLLQSSQQVFLKNKSVVFFVLFGSFGNEPMQSCSVRRVSLSASASVYSPPSDSFDHRSFISYKYMQAMPLVYAHEILSQCDVYFLNGGHFSKFLYLALLST